MKIKEEEIISLIKQGQDKLVIEHLYTTIFPKVKKYIRTHHGNIEDAADVFQEVISTFYRQVISNTYNETYTVYGYLYKMSINRWFNLLRKTNRVDLIDAFEGTHYELSEENQAFTTSKTNEQKNLLQTFFSNLGDRCLELLQYSIFQSLLLEDIALRMGIVNADAANIQLFRCKQQLLKTLKNNPELKLKLQNLI